MHGQPEKAPETLLTCCGGVCCNRYKKYAKNAKPPSVVASPTPLEGLVEVKLYFNLSGSVQLEVGQADNALEESTRLKTAISESYLVCALVK